MLLNAVQHLRAAVVHESRPLLALSVALLGASAAAFLFGKLRHRQLLTGARLDMEVPHLAPLSMSLATLVASAAGILGVALHHIQ